MQDSSTNPYIPQETEAIRQKVYDRQSPLARFVKWALIATGAVAVLFGLALIFVIPRTTTVDSPGRIKLADALQPPDQMDKQVGVASSVGFKLSYDNHVFSSYAEVGDSTAGSDTSDAITSGQTYENNDLRTTRAYNYVRIRPVESVDTSRSLLPLPPEFELFATVTDKDLTAAANVPENKGLSKLSLFVKLDSDKRLSKRKADDNTIVTIDASKPVTSTIGGVDYQMVRYTTTNDNHRISDSKYDECYYTIQYAQPYALCITSIRPTNVSAASLTESVLNSITYEQPASTGGTSGTSTKNGQKTSYLMPTIRLAQATTGGDPSSSSSSSVDVSGGTSSDAGASGAGNATTDSGASPLITVRPEFYGDESSLKAIAKNQPSIVRIGTLYCADLSLEFESGATAATLSNACAGNVASGVIVSKDGYIATTGHAIRNQKKAAIGGYINMAPDQASMLDRLQHVLDYLLSAKIILQSDADYLKTGASTGDQEALAKIENIGSVIPDNFINPVSETYSYAIQPADKPIVLDTTDANKPAFAYSDTVLNAKYIASNYDASKSVQEAFGSSTPTTDVGLLKVDGNFQDVPIASQENMKSNDTLVTLGYTAYTDSSLAIDKIRNQPIATVSKVDQAYQKDGTRLIQTDTPVLPGNDGAPVFDATGQLVGFAVYGLTYCPDQQCFANGTVRSSSELQKLLSDNNVNLQTGSDASVNWQKGVDDYFHANYTASTNDFALAGTQYSFNVWATPLQKLAASEQGTTKDTSFMNQLSSFMVITVIVLVILTILLAITYFLHRRQINRLQVGHYGAQATAAPGAPSVSPTLPPVQSFGIPQPGAQPTVPQQPIHHVAVLSESPSLPIRGSNPQLPQVPVPQPPVAQTPQTPPAYAPQTPQPQPQPPAEPPKPPTDPFYQ